MMKFVKTCFILLLLISTCGIVRAQYFTTGQDPASIRWKQINTEEFQLIFPAEFENKAKYVAAIFQDLLSKGGKNLDHQPKKFSVIFHTQSATSNGMVAWAPKRMEVYTTSPQDNESQLWLNHLAIHEYRHVIQLDKLEQGFTRLLNYVFGQQATIAVVGMYLPPWFLEGDAVCAETALSEAGRGRLPFFEQELRAQLLEKGTFSYDKAVNGSYADFVSDRYALGYYLVGKARVNYGDELWNTTLNRVGQRPLGITSFATGIKKAMQPQRDAVYQRLAQRQKDVLAQGIKAEAMDWEQVKQKNTRGDGKLMLYYDVLQELEWEWKVQDAQITPGKFTALAERENCYTNRRFPHTTESGDVIVLRKGLADAAYFEKITPQGKSEKLMVPGFGLTGGFDYNKGKLIWAERKEHLRWEKADKSVVVSYNTKTKKRKTYKARYNWFAPSYSADGGRFVAVEADYRGNNALVVVNESSGIEEQRFAAGDYEYYLTPKWSSNGQSIVCIQISKQGKQLVQIDLATGKKEILYQAGNNEISQPEPAAGQIFFTASFSGTDNLYAYEFATGKVYQISSSRFGARDAHLSKDKQLYYADYTSDGYLPVKLNPNQQERKEWNAEAEPEAFPLAEQLSGQLEVKVQPDTAKLNRFQVKNYSKLGHLFNIHSWAPVFIDGLEQESDMGVSIASQNKLSTLLATAGYKREEGYDNGQLYVNLSYRGLFPIFDSKFTTGSRSSRFVSLAERVSPPQVDTVLVDRELTQWNWENSIRLPFNLSGGQYSTHIIPKFTYNWVKFTDLETKAIATTRTNPLGLGQYNFSDQDFTQEIAEYQLFAYNIAKTAPRDVQYQWAQILELNYRHTPFGDRDLGNTWSAEASLYFPGLYQHHGTKFYGGYQNRSKHNSLFGNTIKSPRGMRNLYGVDIATFGVDYSLPLGYPDWSLGPLAYFKRIKMTAFFDYGYQKQKILNKQQKAFYQSNGFVSFGAEFRTDLHAFRFPSPIEAGVRIGYENQSKATFANFLFAFPLNSY